MRVFALMVGLVVAAGLVGLPSRAYCVAGEPCRVQGFELTELQGQSKLTIWIDGTAEASSFTLSDPARVVIDLDNALLATPGSRKEGTESHVEAIRYSQFAAAPRPITRIVLDLREDAPYRVETNSQGLEVYVGKETDSVPAPTASVADPTPVKSAEAVLPSTPNSPEEKEGDDVAVITYLTRSTIYVNAGRTHGLSEGDRLYVLHEGNSVASIRVESLSSKRAACAIVDQSDELAIGDEIALNSSASGVASETSYLHRALVPTHELAGTSTVSGEGWLRANGFRGRIGARYLAVLDRTTSRQSFHQPALDMRLDGRNMGGSPFDLSVDVRTRQTYRYTPEGDASAEGRSRVYRANLAFVPLDRKLSFTLGRQLSPEHPALGIFDGGALVLRMSTWSIGVLSGSQPDDITFGYSDAIREHGGFVQLRSAQGSRGNWSATIGAIASYAGNEINREYLSMQSSLSAGRVSAYVSQDVDWNRDWRREAEGQDFSLTNTYSTLRLQATRMTTFSMGYDNRRNIRLYRDYISPETEFDDAYRQGYWAGIDQRLSRLYRFSAKAKRSTGGSAGRADSYTFSAAAQWAVAFRGRSTWYENQLVRGWIHSGSASVQLGSSLRLEIGGGIRDETNATPGQEGQYLRWYNSLLDYTLGRNWYLSFSFERSDDGPEANDQIYSMINYRF